MVLLVDDDQDFCDSIRDLLLRRGYAVVTARDGQQALDTLSVSQAPCVVLLDLVMPGMDGWGFLTVVKADPQMATIPIVVASAHSATHAPTGVAGVLQKPFALADLFSYVERYCGPARIGA